jgi:hypothetical protein
MEDGSRGVRDVRWGIASVEDGLPDAATKRAGKLRAKSTECDSNGLTKLEPDKCPTDIRTTSSQHCSRGSTGEPAPHPLTAFQTQTLKAVASAKA